MAWCKLEDTARYHFKFNRLAEMLSIRRAEARGLFFGLCSWASCNAPDGLLTGLTQGDIELAADWQGRPGRLVKAFVAAGLLDESPGGLEIHDFFERAESHKAAVRKRHSRDRTETVTGQDRDGLAQRRGEERTREEREETPRALVDAERGTIGVHHPEVVFFEQRHRELFKSPAFTNNQKASAAELIRRCAQSGIKWQTLLEAYSSEEQWGWCNGNLVTLASRVFADVVTWNAKGRPKKKPPAGIPPEPSNNAMLKVQAPGEAVAKLDTDRAQAADPETAKKALAAIAAQLGTAKSVTS